MPWPHGSPNMGLRGLGLGPPGMVGTSTAGGIAMEGIPASQGCQSYLAVNVHPQKLGMAQVG